MLYDRLDPIARPNRRARNCQFGAHYSPYRPKREMLKREQVVAADRLYGARRLCYGTAPWVKLDILRREDTEVNP